MKPQHINTLISIAVLLITVVSVMSIMIVANKMILFYVQDIYNQIICTIGLMFLSMYIFMKISKFFTQFIGQFRPSAQIKFINTYQPPSNFGETDMSRFRYKIVKK